MSDLHFGCIIKGVLGGGGKLSRVVYLAPTSPGY